MATIVHVMLCSRFHLGMGYQENLLTSKQRELGHDVSVITYRENADDEILSTSDGVTIYQLPRSIFSYIPFVSKCFDRAVGLYKMLETLLPDIIFVHQTYAADYLKINKYKNAHREVVVYADNHDDYYNSPVKSIKDIVYRKVICRNMSRKFSRVCTKIWGVTPWRVDYLADVYGVPREKIDLLVMGGDDKLVVKAQEDDSRRRVRKDLDIPETAFVLITGGKIDEGKNIDKVLEAVDLMGDELYLIVFGKFSEAMMDKCMKYMNKPSVKNIGWISPDDVYKYFTASDMGVFPGTHSVLWEQACASGLPCIFKDWDGGFNHVDCGGNCIMLYGDVTTHAIMDAINKIISDKNLFLAMRKVAQEVAKPIFSYSVIARRSVGM